MNKKIFVFDQDGTLLWNPFYPLIYDEIIKDYNLKISRDELRNLFFEIHRKLFKMGRYRDSYDWDAVLEEVLKLFNIADRPDFMKYIRLNIEKGNVCLLQGATDLLREIKERGGKIIILTNGVAKFQIPILTSLNIREFLDIIITIDNLPKPKPYKEAFDAILEMNTKYCLDDIIIIGDHPLMDVYGAIISGFSNIIWIKREEKAIKCVGIREIYNMISEYANFYGLEIDNNAIWKFNKKILVIGKPSDLIQYLSDIFEGVPVGETCKR